MLWTNDRRSVHCPPAPPPPFPLSAPQSYSVNSRAPRLQRDTKSRPPPTKEHNAHSGPPSPEPSAQVGGGGWVGRTRWTGSTERQRKGSEGGCLCKVLSAHTCPADIVFCRRQAFYCCLKTHGSALTQPQKPGTALDACMHEQVGLFMCHKQPVKRAFLQDGVDCLFSV